MGGASGECIDNEVEDVSDSRLWPLACRATRRTDFGGVRREGVQGEALRPAEEGDEWTAATDRSLLAGDVGATGEAASQRASSCVASVAAVAGSLSPSATRGDSGDVEGFVVEGNAMARRVGGAGMRDGTAAASFFPLTAGSAGRASAATRWAHSTTSAYSGRESSSGRALKSLSCARQASRSAGWRPAGEGGDILKIGAPPFGVLKKGP